LTVIFFPQKRAEALFAESVMKESSLKFSATNLASVRVGHLRTIGWSLIQFQSRLVLSIDRFVSKKSSRGNHRSGHAVSEEEDHVLCLFAIRQWLDFPSSSGLGSIVVGEEHIICAGLMQLDVSVGLGQDIDRRDSTLLLSKEILVVGEIVFLDWSEPVSLNVD
jgi:hypothetical protein